LPVDANIDKCSSGPIIFEMLSSAAAPFLMVMQQHGSRFGPSALPFPGVGCFFSVRQGRVGFVALPMAAVMTDKINSLATALSFMQEPQNIPAAPAVK
jgi:hypothetical protein